MHALVALLSAICLSSCEKDESPAVADITVTCTPERGAFTADGGTQTFRIESSRGEWTAYTNDSWLTVATSSKDEISVTAQPNTDPELRNGQVTVKSGTARLYIPIEQSAAVKITLSPNASTVASAATVVEFEVITSPVSDWNASTDAEWLSVEKQGNKLKVNVSENEMSNIREADIVVSTGSVSSAIHITQKGNGTITCPVSPDLYSLVWHDEFDADGILNSPDWTYQTAGPGWVNNELQTYVSKTSPKGQSVAEVKDGILSINLFKEDNTIYSGRIYAKANSGWQYGYIEASIKLPKGKGTWPAFWMMPVNFKSWPEDGEIDIMEEVGCNPNYVSSSLHATGHVHSNNTQITHEMLCSGAESEFHTYGIEWTADCITTYVDGKVQLKYNNPGTGKVDWPYDAPFYVIFNVAWGGMWGGMNGVDEKALPTSMQVDYVRVFQKK